MRRRGFTKAGTQQWRCDARRPSLIHESEGCARLEGFRAFIVWVTGKGVHGRGGGGVRRGWGQYPQGDSAKLTVCASSSGPHGIFGEHELSKMLDQFVQQKRITFSIVHHMILVKSFFDGVIESFPPTQCAAR